MTGKRYLPLLAILFAVVSAQDAFEQCYSDVTAILTDPAKILESTFFKYSGKGINDLGDYDHCERDKNSNYALAKADMKEWAAIGVCLPSSCDSRSAEGLSDMLS